MRTIIGASLSATTVEKQHKREERERDMGESIHLGDGERKKINNKGWFSKMNFSKPQKHFSFQKHPQRKLFVFLKKYLKHTNHESPPDIDEKVLLKKYFPIKKSK